MELIDVSTVPTVIAALITVISPFIVSFFNKVQWSPEIKNAVAFGVALVIAVVYLITAGGITDWTNIAIVIPAVYGLQQLVYKHLLKTLAKKVESATTKGSAVVVPKNSKSGITVTSPDTVVLSDDDDSVVQSPGPVHIDTKPTGLESQTPAKG